MYVCTKDGTDESTAKYIKEYLLPYRQKRGSQSADELLSSRDTGGWRAKKFYIAFSDHWVNPALLFMEMDYQPNQWADKVMKYSTMASFPASSI